MEGYNANYERKVLKFSPQIILTDIGFNTNFQFEV